MQHAQSRVAFLRLSSVDATQGREEKPPGSHIVARVSALTAGGLLYGLGLGFAASPGHGASTKSLGFGVREVKLSNALPRIRERDSNRRALSFRNVVARLVADPNRLARHSRSFLVGYTESN